MSDPERADAISRYTESLLESRNWEVKLKNLRLEIKDLEKEKAQAQMWGGAGQNRSGSSGFGAFGAPTSSATQPASSSAGNGLDDLLF